MYIKGFSALVAGGLLLIPAISKADPISVTYLGAGVQTPNQTAVCGNTPGCTVAYETFSYAPTGASSSYTSTFSSGTGLASIYTGVYSSLLTTPASLYGGAGGTGNYDQVAGGSTSTLTITNNQTGGGINYFGMWISALDAGNQLQFYNGDSLVYTFTSQNLINSLGSCTLGHLFNAYCGNPNSYYADAGELFAYVNFTDTAGTFNKIVFKEIGTGGSFETDNHAVAYNMAIDPTAGSTGGSSGGSGSTAAPEPASLALMGVGLAGLAATRRRVGSSGLSLRVEAA